MTTILNCNAGKGRMRMRMRMVTMITMTFFACCFLSSPLLTASFAVVPSRTTRTTTSSTTTTTTTTSSSLSMSSSATTLQHVSDFYQNFPIQAAVLTCGVKASVADTVAQIKSQASLLQSKTASVVKKSNKTDNNMSSNSNNNNNIIQNFNLDLNYFNFWEGRRNLAYVLYGGIYIGLMSYLEYSYVFPSLFGYEKTIQILVEKVLFDNFFVAPFIWLPPAYIIKAWVYSGDDSGGIDDNNDNNDSTISLILKEGYNKYMHDIMNNNLLTMYWTIWLPAQTISFSVVPDHLRVAFMASISFFWFILFSTVASSSSSSISSDTSSEQ